jgi:imidazolonepropionase-like amidohydrolase
VRNLAKLLIGAAALAIAAPAAAQTVAITGGRVVIGDGSEPIDNGTVVIRNGRVVAAGANVAVPAGAQIVEARGRWVTPGLVSGFSRIGLAEVDAAGASTDVSASNSPFSAALDIAPAINPQAAAIAINRAAGITRAVVSPVTGTSIFGGQGAVIDLGSDMDPITRRRAFQFVEMGETGRSAPAGAESRPCPAAQRAARGRAAAGDHQRRRRAAGSSRSASSRASRTSTMRWTCACSSRSASAPATCC